MNRKETIIGLDLGAFTPAWRRCWCRMAETVLSPQDVGERLTAVGQLSSEVVCL